eukprot:TRINITY_DN75899_c0_g1_i1.p1 TRINITY_DN75899_c0_g1~~TRINITY_DN75899_c0_g1_i1.p1  ORF type:complete len:294 (+),score=20.50 TRINITY_DN75899_c0_g1_i1:154-1035(+)
MATLRDEGSSDPANPSGGGHLYNPYADLYPNLDARSIQGIYRLPDDPEYLFPEEAAVHRRSFGDNLTFFTGSGYLLGAILGGARGTVEGFRSWESGDTMKLRANRLLNAAGSRGRATGNAIGVVGLLYSGLEGAAYHYRGGVEDPEYLFPEEAAVHRRSFGDNLTFFTGSGYLLGAILGGARGTVEGFRSWESGDTMKLRANRLLNAAGSRGRATGNAIGVVGLLYSGLEGAAYHYRGGVEDPWNAVIGGLGAGAFYKAAAGPRTAAIAGALGGVAAAAFTASRHAAKRYLAF